MRAGAEVRWFSPLLIAAALAGCSASSRPPEPQAGNVLWGKYIAGHTAGTISRGSRIRVLFAEGSAVRGRPGTSADSLIDIEPRIRFTSVFAGEREVVITPAEPLEAGKTYRVRMHLRKFVSANDKLDTYEFPVDVMPRDFDVQLGGLVAVSGSAREMTLTGTLTTADYEDAERIESLLGAKLGSKALKLEWMHASDGHRHDFVISRIPRRDRAGTVQVSWNGAPIGVQRKGEISVLVPAAGAFEMTHVVAVSEVPQHIAIAFSEPLDTKQRTAGLIHTDQPHGRVRIDGNWLRIYPDKRFSGPVSLRIDPSLRSARGERSSEVPARVVEFAPTPPQVRFADAKSDRAPLRIPVEAINANSFQVSAWRIADQSTASWLRAEKTDGDGRLDAEAQFLWRKTIVLPAAHRDEWSRYEIDSAQLLKDSPGGLYRLTVSLNRSNAAYPCEARKPAKSGTGETLPQTLEGYAGEMSEGERDRSGWTQRADPCHDAYYRYATNVRETRSMLASDIALLSRRDQRGRLHVVATSVDKAEPIAETALQVFDRQGQPVGSASTDADGFATIEAKGAPSYLLAQHQGHKAYLRLAGSTALAASHGDIVAKDQPVAATIYCERDAWRPGDDIKLTLAVRSGAGNAAAGQPVTLQLYDPRNQLVQSVTSNRPVNGAWFFKLTTAQDAPTGDWTVRARLNGNTVARTVKIESVTGNRIDVALDLSRGAGQRADLPINGRVSAQWPDGGMASGLKTDVTVRMESVPTRFERHPDFVFDDAGCGVSAEQRLFEGRLDGKGQVFFEHEPIAPSHAPGALLAHFVTRVQDEDGRFSAAQTSVPMVPYARFVGIKLPRDERGRSVLATDEPHTLAVATLDAQGKPVSLPKVRVALYRLDDDGREPRNGCADPARGDPVIAGEVTTVNGLGGFDLKVDYPQWGRYLVRACDAEGGHCAASVLELDWQGWADARGSGAEPGAMSLVTETSKVKVGESAVVRLPSGAQGKALVVVDNGAGIVEKRWLAVAKSDPRIELPVSEAMAPRVTVDVTLIDPSHNGEEAGGNAVHGAIQLEVQAAPASSQADEPAVPEASPAAQPVHQPFRARFGNASAAPDPTPGFGRN